MKLNYEERKARSEECERFIESIRANDDPIDSPLRKNFAGKSLQLWMEVVRCYEEILTFCCQFNQAEKAKEHFYALIDLVKTCDEFTSWLAIHLLLTLKNSIAKLETMVPESRQKIKEQLEISIWKMLHDYEMRFFLLALTSNAFDMLRDLAEDEDDRRIVDARVCNVMGLAAHASELLNNLDGAELWYRSAAKITYHKLGHPGWTNYFLQEASRISQLRWSQPPSAAFIQAMQADPTEPEYAAAMNQLSTQEQLNVMVAKGHQRQHAKRFLPFPEEFIAEYASEQDVLTKLLNDERLVLNKPAIEARAAAHVGQGLAGSLDGITTDRNFNPRGSFNLTDQFTEQYVSEVVEVIDQLFLSLRESGVLEKDRIHAELQRTALNYNWTIFEVGLTRYFDNDYISSAHVLIPQLENIIRDRARNAGISTKRLDKNDVASEQLLGWLVHPTNSDMQRLLGASLLELIFWYMADDRLGHRHSMAHGWIHPEQCTHALSAMTIWFTLRVTLTA